jgi:hypothetical protein
MVGDCIVLAHIGRVKHGNANHPASCKAQLAQYILLIIRTNVMIADPGRRFYPGTFLKGVVLTLLLHIWRDVAMFLSSWLYELRLVMSV